MVFPRWWCPVRWVPLDELMRRCEAGDVRARRIDVDYASHSGHVDAIRAALAEALAGIEPRSSSVALFSTVTGELLDTAGLDADYWYRSIRQTVQFERAVRNACGAGYRVFVESSPHPVLLAAVEETLADRGRDVGGDAFVIPSLGRDDGFVATVLAFGGPGARGRRAGGLGFRDRRFGRAARGFADVWLCAAAVLAAGRIDGGGGRGHPGAGRRAARAAGRGGAAARFRRGGADGAAVDRRPAMAGRPRGGRHGVVPRCRVCGAGRPRRRRGRLWCARGADVVGAVGVAGDGWCAGAGGGRRRRRRRGYASYWCIRPALRRSGCCTPRAC